MQKDRRHRAARPRPWRISIETPAARIGLVRLRILSVNLSFPVTTESILGDSHNRNTIKQTATKTIVSGRRPTPG